ncbi:MAG: hypothetical protein ACK5O2_17265 [Microthrixaceae bacterium]
MGRTPANRSDLAQRYVDAYRNYCWTVNSIGDLQLAPFVVLAGEGQVHATKPHAWHLALIDKLCLPDPALLRSTERRVLAPLRTAPASPVARTTTRSASSSNPRSRSSASTTAGSRANLPCPVRRIGKTEPLVLWLVLTVRR